MVCDWRLEVLVPVDFGFEAKEVWELEEVKLRNAAISIIAQ